MSSVNLVILVGNLAADPDIKTTIQGSRIARLRLITSQSYKDKEGGRKEMVHGHNIVVFNERLVDVIESYGRKGQKVAIQGKLENRTWEDSDGVKHYETEVVLPRYGGEFNMLGSSGDGGSNNSSEDRDNRVSNKAQGNTDRNETRSAPRSDDNRESKQNQQPSRSRDDDFQDSDVPF